MVFARPSFEVLLQQTVVSLGIGRFICVPFAASPSATRLTHLYERAHPHCQ
jgi:hypothetical protein